jgi:cytochrome c-type biogenesis protein CcmH/NrfG
VTVRNVVLAFSLLSMAAWPWAAIQAAAEGPAATIKRDFDACRAHANIDACYDALRWKPSDPQLLVALGDAQMRAHRTADAIRTYKRAAQISPDMAGLSAKISAAEARPAKRAPPIAAHADPGKRFSNAAPEAQSH